MSSTSPSGIELIIAILQMLSHASFGAKVTLTVIVCMIGALYFWFTSLRFVIEAERGMRLRFGKVVRGRDGKPKIYEPGALVIIPHIEALVSFRVRQQTVSVPPQVFTLQDNTIWRVDAVIRFIVTDVYKARYGIDNLDHSLIRVAMAALRDVMQQVKDSDQLKDTSAIAKQLVASLEEYEEMWGISVDEFRLRDCQPLEQTATIITTKALIATRVKELADNKVTNPLVMAALLGLPTVGAITSPPDERDS